MKFLPLFIAIQLASLVLTVLGIPICALLAACNLFELDGALGAKWHWSLDPLTWIWDNEIDGVVGPGPVTRWQAFYWSALRNPCNNLRFVAGVSKVGRPLWYGTFTMAGREFYAKAGWMSDGYPCLSAGGGRGY